ncbi:hypothetical protein GGQ07_003049 [Salinibacter ruber]|nr:hypothetical protein [Salinibacter ruber]MCS3856437.1 hypothetical protein [Salinibacter ruber]MCS4142202.1 hypothetical protein [Salinibacter ruber]MCS4181590.1 hypothetical protein [Salinibacter ruber]
MIGYSFQSLTSHSITNKSLRSRFSIIYRYGTKPICLICKYDGEQPFIPSCPN